MIKIKEKQNIGIGFVTGRKNFKDVLKTYVSNWDESGIVNKKNALHLFVAYDLKYKNTKVSDYKISDEDVLDTVDSAYYVGDSAITNEMRSLVNKKIITLKEANLIFADGYAGKRNLILYFAIKNKMDYLIFLDDDEYPLAVTKTNNSLSWTGQEVLATHMKHITDCDITHGHHCGYISPIPSFEFNDSFTEKDFQTFIEAISNDIVNWASIQEKRVDGGIQYTDPAILESSKATTINEIDGMKFISGANLGFNLKNLSKIYPFYNPPGARGEDTFLSSCLTENHVKKVPCYTFHDGFSMYNHLLFGSLPNHLEEITGNSAATKKRFYKATLGWIRYKPLFLYLTRRESYEDDIKKIRTDLLAVLPKVCSYFKNEDFNKLLKELDYYDAHVEKHYKDFQKAKKAWQKIMAHLEHSEFIR